MIYAEFQKRVRYNETDQMGYLYHGHYAHYYEIGRVEWLRSMGLSYRDMEEKHGIFMPVVSLQMRFVRPARYDDLLTIQTTLREIPEKFINFHVRIFNEEKKLVNGGTVRLCFFDRDRQQTIPAPNFLVEQIRQRFEEA
jgi:acyl-CoA thioester hydrolase